MRTKLPDFFTVLAVIASAIPVHAQSFTIPEGVMTYSFPANQTSYFSFPLSADPTYADAVSTVTTTGTGTTLSSTITVANASAFTAGALIQPTSSVPYYIKFMSGAQMGRVLLITGNTASTLTFSTAALGPEPLSGNSDSITSAAPTTFNVSPTVGSTPGDSFEVFAGDTLSTAFGNYVSGGVGNFGNSSLPLVVAGGTGTRTADTIGLPSTSTVSSPVYYFDTTVGYWVQYLGPTVGGEPVNANNTPIPPYSALQITVRSTSVSLSLTGRVSEVPLLTQTVPNATVFTSTQYPTDLTLSQLNFGSNWAASSIVRNADTLTFYNTSSPQIVTDVFYQDSTLTWHQYLQPSVSENSYPIPAGSVISLTQRGSPSGAACFLQSVLPYSVTQ